MASSNDQKTLLYRKFIEYKKRYIKESNKDLDESATRIMINNLLSEVFGYIELEDIKTEYSIKGGYADYVIQIERKKHFIVEVKAIQLDLSEKHLRQSVSYAANEGIDWIILTNGRQLELYRVIFSKPIGVKKIFDVNFADESSIKKSLDFLYYITKKSVLKNELTSFWKRFEALTPSKLAKNLYSVEVVKFLKKTLKNNTGIVFSDDDILESIHQIIVDKIDSVKPKSPIGSQVKKENKVVESKTENTQSIISDVEK